MSCAENFRYSALAASIVKRRACFGGRKVKPQFSVSLPGLRGRDLLGFRFTVRLPGNFGASGGEGGGCLRLTLSGSHQKEKLFAAPARAVLEASQVMEGCLSQLRSRGNIVALIRISCSTEGPEEGPRDLASAASTERAAGGDTLGQSKEAASDDSCARDEQDQGSAAAPSASGDALSRSKEAAADAGRGEQAQGSAGEQHDRPRIARAEATSAPQARGTGSSLLQMEIGFETEMSRMVPSFRFGWKYTCVSILRYIRSFFAW